jgi:hypothetical protein
MPLQLPQEELRLAKEVKELHQKHVETPTFDNRRALEIAEDDLLAYQKSRIK